MSDDMSVKRFRIALSFAGEKRDFVAEVAARLARQLGEETILYDKFHTAEFSRSDLAFYLPDLYHQQTDLVVAVFCADYENKEWCGLEWNAIFDMLKKRRVEEVMLTRFGHVEGKGLYSGAGYSDLDHETPESAANLILERLALNEGKPKHHYTANTTDTNRPAKSSIPNNLPRLQSFFGRATELTAIREALDPESRSWGVLIDGPGGMGKTSLAVRAAYDCSPDQFKKIIFVSVKDRELDDDGERKLTGFILPGFIEMLNELARELEQPNITKAPQDQRIRLLLDALRPAEALLILDNLESLTKEDRDQLFTFVKRLPQGCKAILTSRRRIGSGSELLILEKLDETAALATLADLARHNPLLAKTSAAERIALYTQTGGNPLLLRWVASQLGRGSCRSFADALHFLRACPPDNDPLEFVFGDLATEFTNNETRILVALSYFDLPANVAHIATLAGLDTAPVEVALRTLANRSLVVPNQEEIKFSLVTMVADFLRRARPEVVADISNRLEQRAYSLIVENGYNDFPILDDTWPTVAPALPLFVTGPNSRLQTVCDALLNFLDFTGRWDELLSFYEKAESKAMASDDHNNAGRRANDMGNAHLLCGRTDTALACAMRADTHWGSERGSASRLRAIDHQKKAEYSATISAYRETIKLFRLSGESEHVARALSDLAKVEWQGEDLVAAERNYREALRVALAVSYTEGVVTYKGNLIELALVQKKWPEAETLARDALLLSEPTGRQELIADNCHRLAQALVRQGKDGALPHAQRAVDIYTRLGSPRLKAARAMLRECEG